MKEQREVRVTLRNGVQATVRPLTTEDGPALAEFYAGIPAEDSHFYRPHPLTREQALAKAAGAGRPGLVCLVLETDDNRIGGEAWCRWTEPHAMRSSFGICIRRDLQGVGAGKTLIRLLFENTTGPPVISLTVQKANPRAVALYKSMGFRIVREQVRADGEPEYYMERPTR